MILVPCWHIYDSKCEYIVSFTCAVLLYFVSNYKLCKLKVMGEKMHNFNYNHSCTCCMECSGSWIFYIWPYLYDSLMWFVVNIQFISSWNNFLYCGFQFSSTVGSSSVGNNPWGWIHMRAHGALLLTTSVWCKTKKKAKEIKKAHLIENRSTHKRAAFIPCCYFNSQSGLFWLIFFILCCLSSFTHFQSTVA